MSKLTDKSTRSPEEIRAEIAHHKDEIVNSISAAKDNLKADEVLEASVDYVAEKSNEVYIGAKEYVRENPMPVVLATAGIASLVVAGLQLRAKRSNQFSNNSTSNLEKATHYASDKFAEIQDTVKDKASYAQKQLQYKSKSITQTLQSFAYERPVLTACIGAAIGAAIGGSLPRTKFEDDTFGPFRDQSFDNLQHSAEQLIADTKDAVTHSIEKNVDIDSDHSFEAPRQKTY